MMKQKLQSHVHPGLRKFLDAVASSGVPGYHLVTPEQARQQYRNGRHIVAPEPPEIHSVESIELNGPYGLIPARLYRPSSASELQPVLVYFHGGGWTIGDLDTHDVLCRQLANETPCAVLSVDYRLAPENPFPAALDDCAFATNWIAEHASSFNLDSEKIAVGGDSAGGNLAAAVALQARDQGRLNLVFQLLIYPATDQRIDLPSHYENAEGFALTRNMILNFRSNYLPLGNFNDWRASPLLAKDLSGLPPALVMTAGFDPLRDEGIAYAERLHVSGCQVELVNYTNMIHGFIRMGRIVPEVAEAISHASSALATSFSIGSEKNIRSHSESKNQDGDRSNQNKQLTFVNRDLGDVRPDSAESIQRNQFPNTQTQL